MIRKFVSEFTTGTFFSTIVLTDNEPHLKPLVQ